MQKVDIIVIGSGVAGMTAALHLAKTGLKVKLIEARNFIGGRTYSFKEKETHFELDNGQHLLAGAYVNYFNFLKEIGSYKYIKFQKGIDINFIDTEKNKYRLYTGLFPSGIGKLLGFLKFDALKINDKLNLLKLLLKIERNFNFEHYDNVQKFLLANKQSEISIKYFWEPLCLAVMNNNLENSDFEIFHNTLSKLFSGGNDNASLAYSTVPLSQLYANYSEIFNNYGGDLILGEKINKVNIKNNKISSVCSINKDYIADKYIFAVTPSAISNIFGNSLPKNLGFKYSTIISAYIDYEFQYNLPEITGTVGTFTHWIFNRNKLYSDERSDIGLSLAITISAANDYNDMPNEIIKRKILDELSMLFGEKFKSAKYIKLIKDKKATPLIDIKSKLMRFNRLPYLKNAFFIGDWTDTKLPATIEGACFSANKCVEIILHN